MKKPVRNVTIALPEDLAKWVRVHAAENDTSISKYLGDILKERMESESMYSRAMERYLTRDSSPLRKPGESLPGRDSLHER
ncbi:MAG: hypothetical protein RQ801_14625 [Spirochaetaceae bacterium]|nr:hypothetical protein [Spirochaetaceae bacterium]MDT8299538.1 hypothetical protein [Spirochaetaceae bacterium]